MHVERAHRRAWECPAICFMSLRAIAMRCNLQAGRAEIGACMTGARQLHAPKNTGPARTGPHLHRIALATAEQAKAVDARLVRVAETRVHRQPNESAVTVGRDRACRVERDVLPRAAAAQRDDFGDVRPRHLYRRNPCTCLYLHILRRTLVLLRDSDLYPRQVPQVLPRLLVGRRGMVGRRCEEVGGVGRKVRERHKQHKRHRLHRLTAHTTHTYLLYRREGDMLRQCDFRPVAVLGKPIVIAH